MTKFEIMEEARKILVDGRKRKGLSTYKVEKLSGISKRTILHAEAGEPITMLTFATLCECYGIDPF